MRTFILITLFFLYTSAAHAQLPDPAPVPDRSSHTQATANSTSTESTPTAPPATSSGAVSVSVGGVSMDGLTEQEALQKLKTELGPLLQRKVSLNDGNQVFWRTRAEVGASIPYAKLLESAKWLRKHGGGNVPVRFNVDIKKATAAMKAWAKKADHAASTPSLGVSGDKVVLHTGKGFELATVGSAQRIKQALEATPSELFIQLVSRQTPAHGSNVDLTPFKYVIGQFSTRYNPNLRGRTVNLKKSAENIDGTIVPAGGVFSANKAIGPRNESHGWKEAKMFVNGDVVDGIGAGICQSATTLYNAALLAGLPIVERHQHQFRVYYAPASRDATLYWGQKDFKFRNDTGGPIYVQTKVQNSHYIVRLYGTKPVTEKISVESKVLSRRNGATRSEAFRITNGKRELLSRDSYLPDKAH